MKVDPIRTRIFKEGDSIEDFVVEHVRALPEKAIIIITSKIVAIAEGRTVPLGSTKEKVTLIKQESDFAIKTKYVWLTVKDGMIMANAGIDESNADGKIILLPKDSFRSAAKIRKELMKRYGRKQLGVLITDSRTVPLRSGVMGIALGYAGLKGIRDYRGTSDIFGREFKMSRTDVADGLAASAVLVMGEGAERYPLALITDAPVEFSDVVHRRELIIPVEDDMYGPLFKRFRA